MNDSNPKKKPIFDLSALNLPDLTDSLSDDKQHAQQSGEKFIVFALDDELFAVSSKQVVEVTRPLAITPLPNVPEWLLGIANLRGEIISVADLQKSLGKKSSKLSPKSKFIIVRSQNSGASVAFTIDKLSEFITLSNDEIQIIENEKSLSIFGKAVYKSNTLQLIDLIKLFASLELRTAKTQA